MKLHIIAKIKTIHLFRSYKDPCINIDYQDVWDLARYKKLILFEGYY
jgi:hypothetical protein